VLLASRKGDLPPVVEDPLGPPGQEEAEFAARYIEKEEDPRLEGGPFDLEIGLLPRPGIGRHEELSRDPRERGAQPRFDPFKNGPVRHTHRPIADLSIIAKQGSPGSAGFQSRAGTGD
jgi:hypothetical protein